MRKIVIKSIYQTPGKFGYEVPLGNGICQEFKSKREARKFIAETNRFLTEKMFNTNLLYISSWMHYRKLWPQINQLRFEGKIKTDLDSCHNCLNRLVMRASGENGNYYAFIDLSKSLFFLSGAVCKLSVIDTVKTSVLLKRELNYIDKTIDRERISLAKYSRYRGDYKLVSIERFIEEEVIQGDPHTNNIPNNILNRQSA